MRDAFNNFNLPLGQRFAWPTNYETPPTLVLGDFIGLAQTGILEVLKVVVNTGLFFQRATLVVDVYANDGSPNPTASALPALPALRIARWLMLPPPPLRRTLRSPVQSLGNLLGSLRDTITAPLPLTDDGRAYHMFRGLARSKNITLPRNITITQRLEDVVPAGEGSTTAFTAAGTGAPAVGTELTAGFLSVFGPSWDHHSGYNLFYYVGVVNTLACEYYRLVVVHGH